MRRSLKNTGLIIIILLYCLVTSFYSGIAFNSRSAFSNQTTSENKTYNSNVSPGLFYHTSQIVNSFNLYNNAAPCSLKISVHKFSVWASATERFFFNTISQYNFYTKYLLVRFRQTDIIFPFHYFW